MQRSSQHCSRDWKHASLRHERYNDLKRFNKVGYVLSYMERPKVTRPTWVRRTTNSPTICL
eukprot:2473677-Heterocapsa_arctica.AAC.1